VGKRLKKLSILETTAIERMPKKKEEAQKEQEEEEEKEKEECQDDIRETPK